MRLTGKHQGWDPESLTPGFAVCPSHTIHPHRFIRVQPSRAGGRTRDLVCLGHLLARPCACAHALAACILLLQPRLRVGLRLRLGVRRLLLHLSSDLLLACGDLGAAGRLRRLRWRERSWQPHR